METRDRCREGSYGRVLSNRFRYYSPELGRYISADPIGQIGGVNVFLYALSNPLALIDPFGLNDCGAFVKALVKSFFSASSPRSLGADLLSKRGTTLSSAGGFKPELVKGGQGGAVARHVYGHAGAKLSAPYGPGAAASYANQAIDYFQRFQENRTVEESEAEIADDRAARKVADALSDAFERREEAEEEAKKSQQCPDLSGLGAALEDTLRAILCD